MPRSKLQAKSSPGEKSTRKGSGKKSTQEQEPKTRRYKPGTRALMEIKRYQKGKDLLIQRAPFQRICREITKHEDPELRYNPEALNALQEAAESYMIGLFADTQLCAIHAGRLSIQDKDMKLALRIRGDDKKRFR